MNLKFLKYVQSNQCNNMNDSSVSYASASLVLEWYNTLSLLLEEFAEKKKVLKK